MSGMNNVIKRILRSVNTPLILGAILAVLPALLPGRGLYWGAASLQFIPWRIQALEQIRQGLVPLWNPLNGMGAPLLANYQLAVFYPPGWILFILGWLGGTEGMVWGFGLLLCAHIAWAGVGTARLMKRLGLGEMGQILAGLAFSLGSFWIGRGSFFPMIWAGSWMPWVLLAVSEIANPLEGVGKSKKFLPYLFILFFTMQLLAGHAQFTWYSLLLAGAWVGMGCWRSRSWRLAIQSLLRLAAGGLAAAAISAIQLIPTAEYLMNSQRADAYGYQQAMVYSFWPWRILTLVFPNLFGTPGDGSYWGYAAYWEDAIYIGLIPVMLAFLTLLLPRGTKRKSTPILNNPQKNPFRFMTGFLWVVVVVSFILALGDNTPLFPWLYQHIPTFNMFQAPTRWNMLTVFALSLLAGVQMDRLQKPTGKNAKRLRFLLVGMAAVMMGAAGARLFMPQIQSTFSESFILAGIFGMALGFLMLRAPATGKKFSLTARWVVAGIVLLDLLIANRGLNPTTKISNYAAPPTRAVVEIQQSGSRVYLPAKEEYLLKFSRFFRFSDLKPLESFDNFRNSLLPNLNLFDGIPSANNFDPLTPERYSLFMHWLEGLPPAGRAKELERMHVGWEEKRVTDTAEGVAFEPLNPRETVQWKNCVEWVDDGEEVLPRLEALLKKENEITWMILEGSPEYSNADCDTMAAEIKYDEQANAVRVEVETKSAGWVLLANTWYPGWEASLDGETTTNYRADYLFQAVRVEEGSHVIEWRYRPVSFWIGATGSGLSILFVLIWGLLSAFRKPSIKEP